MSPFTINAINTGIAAIIIKPVDTPFNTSIVFNVFAVTGIAINIKNGYIIVSCDEPKNKKSMVGSQEPSNIIGKAASNKKSGFFRPPNDFKSSISPIVPAITVTPNIEIILVSLVVMYNIANEIIIPTIIAGPPGYAT